MKIRFIKPFSVKQPGDEKVYDDQYGRWLVEIGVGEEVIEPLKTKEINSVPENKIEKHTVKRTTKNAKG
jgi:hypothetical protein